MFSKAWLAADIAKCILHGHTVCSDHAECINVNDVDVVERLHKVGARDDLSSFVERDLRQSKLVQWIRGEGVGFAQDKGAGENYSCSLERSVSTYCTCGDNGNVRKTSVALQRRRPLYLPGSSIGLKTMTFLVG
jgi:hypothetical protein